MSILKHNAETMGMAALLFVSAGLVTTSAIFLTQPHYHMTDIVLSVIFSAFLAGSFLLSSRCYDANKSVRKILLASLLTGALFTVIEGAILAATCSGEECWGVGLLMPALVIFNLFALFVTNVVLYFLARKNVLGKCMEVFAVLSLMLFSYGVSKWDSDCSRPRVVNGQVPCLVAKAQVTGNHALCHKATGALFESDNVQWCFRDLSQKQSDPDICRKNLTGYKRDACLAEFVRLEKDTALCVEITHPDVRKYYCP